MIYCELRRDKLKQVQKTETITRNGDLVNIINLYAPQRVVLFRAGLIINKAVLATGVPIMNIHCAKIPEYGGIGSIAKALQENAFYQSATLHQVTEAIDQGIVFDTEPYELDPSTSYCMNEDSAYAAGYRLLVRTLNK
jgi:methionyl-tRNA formyltransferase